MPRVHREATTIPRANIANLQTLQIGAFLLGGYLDTWDWEVVVPSSGAEGLIFYGKISSPKPNPFPWSKYLQLATLAN